MAAQNRREIELALAITTANADALTKLQQDVKDLAKEGGAAAPAFQALADELGKLSAQAKQLTAIEGLTTELNAASVAQTEAAQKSGALRTELDALVAATNSAKGAEQAKNLELANAKRAVQDAQDAITRHKNVLDEAEKSTAAYTIELVRLKNGLLAAREEKRRLSGELDVLHAKTVQASAAVTEQGRAYREASKDTDAATAAAQKLQAQIDSAAEKYREAGGAVQNLADAQGTLVTAANAARAAIQAQITEQERLAKAERDLANETLRESAIIADTKRKMAAQAQAEADGIVRDYNRMVEAQRAAATAAKSAADEIANAFGKVGTRSAAEIRDEIDKVRNAMRLLETSGAATGTELSTAMQRGQEAIKGLERELREVTGTLTLADKASTLFKTSLGQIAAGNLVAEGVMYLVERLKDAARAFVEITAETETFRRGMQAVYRDSSLVASQMEFLRSTANNAGVAVRGLDAAFLRFSAANQTAGISLKVSNDLFASVARTASTLGLSADDTSGALNALGQMASKGTVSLEELRQQLGDRMPGAIGAAAKGLGLTEAELIKLVESGKLAARDFFPAFTQGLKQLQGDTEGLLPSWNRLKNVLVESAQNAGDAMWLDVMTAGVKGLALAISPLVLTLNGASEAIGALARSAGILVGALFTLTSPIEALKEVWGAAAQRQDALTESFKRAVVGGGEAAVSAQNLATVTQATAAAATAAGPQWDSLTRSQQAAAVAAELVKLRHGDIGAQIVATTSSIEGLLATQEKETASLNKIAEARKIEGDTLVELARLSGDERATREAAVAAAEMQVKALANVAASQSEELKLLELQRETIVAKRKEQGLATDAINKEVEALDKKIMATKADVDKSREAAEAAKLRALSAELEGAAYRNNAADMETYKVAMQSAAVELARIEELKRAGAATDGQVEAARKALTTATFMYRDSLRDSADAQRNENQERLVSLTAAHSAKSAEVELLQAKARLAAVSGDVTTATELEKKAREAKLEVDKLALDIKEIELRLSRQELELKLEQLKVDEPGNLLKQKELELRIALTKVKEREIAAGRELIKVQEQENKERERTNQLTGEYSRLQSGGGSGGGYGRGGSGSGGGYGRGGSGSGNDDENARRLNNIMNRYRMNPVDGAGKTAEQIRQAALQEIYDRSQLGGFVSTVGKTGDTREAPVMQYDINQAIAKRYGDEFVGNDVAQQAWQMRQLLDSYRKNYGNVVRSKESLEQQRNIAAELARLEAIIEEQRNAMAGNKESGDSQSGTSGGSTGGVSGVRGSGGATNVTINFEGQTFGIPTNAAGAGAVQNFLRQLGNASKRASL